MKRREFIALLGVFASIWPVGARAQHIAQKRVAVLFGGGENDPEFAARLATLKHELKQHGWNEGVNLQFDVRFRTDAQMAQVLVSEVVALAPDVIVANTGNPEIAALQRATRTIPIVFANVTDPVGAGFVGSLARPGGNTTGFTPFEYGISVKWLELLKEVAPQVQRVGVLRDPSNPTGIGMLAAMQGVAPSLGIELTPLGISQANDVEDVIAGFAREKAGGLVVTLNGMTIAHRKLISAAALKHQLAAVYPMRYFAVDGGLLSYGPNSLEPFQGVATYVDRILKGENPADLPVQAPNKFETVVNLKVAKALGLTIPHSILATADVIE